MTLLIIDSGKLGQIVEIQSHYDYFRPQGIQKGFGLLYGLAVHTIDQLISLCGQPNKIHYDVRSIYFPGESDDYVDIDFHYDNYKTTVKCSLAVKINHPKFIVHGDKGSFIKWSSGHQVKNPNGPTNVSFDTEPESNWGQISYVDAEGVEHNERVQSEATDYGILYEKLYQSIKYNGEKPVKDEEVLAVLTILEDGITAAKNSKLTEVL